VGAFALMMKKHNDLYAAHVRGIEQEWHTSNSASNKGFPRTRVHVINKPAGYTILKQPARRVTNSCSNY
jgi:hypothetical protein